MKITRGILDRPQKIVVYGPEGIGKSTFAACFPAPLFLDVEGGTHRLDVARMDPPPVSWVGLLEAVKEFLQEKPTDFSTLVLDTADWPEQLCTASVCARSQKQGIEDFGYGKGYVYLSEEFGKLLNQLEDVVKAGYHVVVLAHAKMRKFEQPDELGSYDRWEMKLSRGVAPMVKEWADMVLFANYKTIVVNVDGQGAQKGKNKAQGGKRVVYTTHTPFWDAKNRMGLPDEMPLDLDAFRPYLFPKGVEGTASGPAPSEMPAPSSLTSKEDASAPAAPPAEPAKASAQEDGVYVPDVLRPLLESASVTEQEVRQVIDRRQKRYFPMGTTWEAMEKAGFVGGWVLPNWEKIVQMIQDDPDRLPF